jgi:hypothetical protein
MHCACCLILFMCMRVCKIMLKSKYRNHGGCDRSAEECLQRNAYSSYAPDPTSGITRDRCLFYALLCILLVGCMRLASVYYLYQFIFAFSWCTYGSWNPVWHMILKPHRPHRCTVTKRGRILISMAASKTGCTDSVWNMKMYLCVYDTCIQMPLMRRNLQDFLATESNSNNRRYYPRVFERTRTIWKYSKSPVDHCIILTTRAIHFVPITLVRMT